MRTFILKQKDIDKKWILVDAEGKVLGRLATEVATILRGKNKPTYTPFLDCGDNVIVINADKIAFNGDRLAKKYYSYSGYPGGLKETNLERMLEDKPEDVITKAVKGMLGRGPLARQQMRNLRVYAGAEHPHVAQNPEKIEIDA